MDNHCTECNKSISKNAKKCNSCNATGRFMSKETRLKLRNINLGNKHSEETKRKKSLAMMGHKVSKETVRKNFEARTKNNSWKQSEETKKKISNTHKRLNDEGKIKRYWIGKKLSKQHSLNMSIGKKGLKLSEYTKKKMLGRIPWNKGKKWDEWMSKEQKEKAYKNIEKNLRFSMDNHPNIKVKATQIELVERHQDGLNRYDVFITYEDLGKSKIQIK